jgi:tryptophanyl-tRNA synthetase
MSKPVVLTGLRANNQLHIGNYFGALLPMIDMAKNKSGEYQINLFVPDLHSFTTPIDHDQLQDQIMGNLRLYVAAGLDLDNADLFIYRQSHVPAHSELTWILDCKTSFGEMRRMTQFKDKSGVQKMHAELADVMKDFAAKTEAASSQLQNVDTAEVSPEAMQTVLDAYAKTAALSRDFTSYLLRYAQKAEELKSSIGLFHYPVLMAADILLYNATYVPVGEDQTQHLEYTRDIATRFNNQFGDIFAVPHAVAKQHEFFGKDQGLRIRDLLDPSKKMSKSDETGKGVIFLGDDPAAAAKKVMGAATDSFGEIGYDIKERPGITNLLQILALLSGRSQDEVNAEWVGKTSYGDFKKAVAEAVSRFLTDFQARLANVDQTSLETKLESSEVAMNKLANATLLRAQQAVGLRPKQ